MKLFSWFIKTNKNLTPKEELNKEALDTSQKTKQAITHVDMQATELANEINTFNNNAMWPIAKVRTATIMIKKPKAKVYQATTEKIKRTKTTQLKTGLLAVQLNH